MADFSFKKFKFSGPVIFKGPDWFTVQWREYAEWCNASYGPGNWEFFEHRFLFKTEADLVLYLLRWE